MLGSLQRGQKTLFIPGSIEDYLPEDHILVKVDKILDLGWLEKEVADFYCQNNGRRSIAPEAAMRLMLAGFFLGIVHDRKLMREAQVNLAIRWFAGFGMSAHLPDHSSLTRIRQRWGAEKFLRMFEKTVDQCLKNNLISAETVHVDATLIRADVNWRNVAKRHGEKVFLENQEDNATNDGKQVVSKTDPDAGLGKSYLQPMVFPSYKQHAVVDDKRGVIVDVDVTSGAVHESGAIRDAVERTTQRIGKVGTVTADKAYSNGVIYKALEEKGIDPLIVPQKTQRRGRGGLPIEKFKYDARNNRAKCPGGKWLTYVGEDRKKGKCFKSKRTDCAKCHLRDRCLGEKKQRFKTIRFIEGYDALLRARRRYARRWNEQERELYDRHKYRVEGIHGEAKEVHGLRRAVRRRLWNVMIQVYLTAAVINLKRLVKALFGGKTGNPSPFLRLISLRLEILFTNWNNALSFHLKKRNPTYLYL